MSGIATNDTLLERFLQIRRPRSDWPAPDRTSAGVDEVTHEIRWESIVDSLLEWRNHPEQIVDEGLLPISRERLDDALWLADAMRKGGFAAPMRVIPNTEGGVSFEHWNGDVFETIEIDSEGNAEARAFKGDRLIAQEPWAISR